MSQAPTCLLLLLGLLACGLMSINGDLILTPLIVDEESGEIQFVLTVTSERVADWNISISTADDSAVADVDYLQESVTLINLPVEADQLFIPVVILPDFEPEIDETFFIRVLSISLPGEQPQDFPVIIADDDREPVQLTLPSVIFVREGVNNVSLTISRQAGTLNAFTIIVNTREVSARQGSDYADVLNRQFSFSAGQTTLTIPDLVHIIDDSETEDLEIVEIIIAGNNLIQDIFIGVFIFDDESPVLSHCRRQGQFCLNGGTCVEDVGICRCVEPFDGPNCAINTNILNGPECSSLPCQRGVCVVNAGVASCICDPGFTGTLCDRTAYYHQCNQNNISVCITPFSIDTFVGEIFVTDHRNTPGCNLTLAPNPPGPNDIIPDWCRGFAGVIAYNGTCGDLGPITEGGQNILQLRLSVRFSPGIVLVTDEELVFNCTFSSDPFPVSSQSLNVRQISGTKNGGISQFTPASQTVARPDGTAIQGTVTSGEDVMACVTVNGFDDYKGIAIHNITVNNTRAPPHYRERVLYSEGCKSADGLLPKNPEWRPNSSRHTMCFEVEVFTFLDDEGLFEPAMGIVTQVRVFATEAAAVRPTCATGRRRRDAPISSTPEDETLTSVLYLAKPKAFTDTTSDETTCAKEWLMPAVIGLGIVSITMVVVIIVLVYAVIRQLQRN